MPQSRITEANRFLEEDNNDEALRLASKELDENPDDMKALFIASRAMLNMDRPGIALPACLHYVNLYPTMPQGWDNLGQAYTGTFMFEEAEEAFRNGLVTDPRNYSLNNSLALLHLFKAEPDKALKYADRAVALGGKDAVSPVFNAALASFMKGDFEAGWMLYDVGLGKVGGDRKEMSYRDPREPRWIGEKGMTVVAYGEQGLGDEIAFASCIPDLKRDCDVIIDCSKRLENLFKRSFGVPTYGTLHDKTAPWVQDHAIDARVAFGSIPRYYRKKLSDFPRKPYLVADPEKRKHWRAILDTYPGKKIGIAWRGGNLKTGQALRSIPIEHWEPILAQNATFIALEHKEFDLHPKVKDFRKWYATDDYDDTAALVAELDRVISVTTAVVDIAGALGTPCDVFVPEKPMWRYAIEPNPWYDITCFRQLKGEPWSKTLRRYAEKR